MATPTVQCGAQQAQGTRDNILKLFVTARHYEENNVPLPVLLVDISQCFDRTRATDVIMETLVAGCDPDVMKFLSDWTMVTNIKLSGDFTGAEGTVHNTVGQGTSLAAMGVSLLIGVGMQKFVVDKHRQECATVGDMTSLPQCFVDDMLAAARDAASLRVVGGGISLAASYCSMEVNDEKSSVIVIGKERYKAEQVEMLKADPVKVQGKSIMVKEDDQYLGITLSAHGVKDSVHQTLNTRFKKARDRAYQLRNMCRHQTFLDIGWLKCIRTFFESCIASTLLYSAETWYYTSEKFMDVVEAKYRELLLIMLGLPKTTKYLSLLHEMDIMQCKHVVMGRRIKYLNNLLNGNGNPQTRNIILHEYQIASDDQKHLTFVGGVRVLCNEYGVPDVMEHNHVTDEMISESVREVNDRECWTASMSGKLTVPRIFLRNNETMYQAWSKSESLAILKYRIGLLKFRAQLRYLAKDGDTTCRNEECDEEDTYSHATWCAWVKSEKPANNTPREVARFIVDLNRERISRFRAPLL